MKARQKWDLLVLNSKDFVNFVMSNLRNFKKSSTLKNVKKLTFSIWKKNTRFSYEISFFALFLLPHMFRNIFNRCSMEN